VAALMALMYVISFVLSLTMAGVDTLIAIKFGVQDDADKLIDGVKNWIVIALTDDSFRDALSLWRGLDRIRFLCCLLGWISACWIQALDKFAADKRNREFATLFISLAHWRERASLLEGAGLEELDMLSLQKLNIMLQISIDRTRTALKTFTDDG